MLTRIISFLMSAIMSVSGMFFTSFSKIIDSVTEIFFGIPFTQEAVKSDFLYELDDNDVVAVDDNNGFIKDLIAVFIDDLSFNEKLNLFGELGGMIVGWSAVTDLYVIRYPAMDYKTVNSKCESLLKLDGIVFAMPVTTSRTVLNLTPNDPFDKTDLTDSEWDELNPHGSNWWLEAIQARQAWDYSDYFNKINIGIVDAGYDLEHPELEGKIFFPSNRLANRNNPDYHGTHVAGLIGAKRNNAEGITGVCDNSQLICVDWNPELLQFWNTDLAILFGFADIVKSGAKVVNFSLGTSGAKKSDSNDFWDEYIIPAALSVTMTSLLSKGYDFVAVQSAGNGDYYGEPMNANYNGHFASVHEDNIITFNGVTAEDILSRIIIVSCVDNKGHGEYKQSNFSNVGKTVSLAAPGDKIYSCSPDGGYGYLSGTSMAAPIVTGVASLVWSVNPDFTGADVKEIVCTSTDAVAQINPFYDYSYDVDLVDYPVVNAKLAVEEAIRRTDSQVGTVSGRIIGEKCSEIVYNGRSHTVFSDGTYSFVAPSSSGTVSVLDDYGNEIATFEITVEAGREMSAGEYVIFT